MNIIFIGALLVLALTVFYSPPLSTQEINAIAVSKSVLAGELSNINFVGFAKSNGFFISPLPILASMFFELLLPHSFTLSKIPNILILLSVYLLYKNFLLKDITKTSSGLVNVVLLVILVTSPWLIQAAIYNPFDLISLAFFVLSAVYLKRVFIGKTSQDKDKRYFFASLTLLSLSSIQGLITSFVLFLASATLFFFKRKKVKAKNILLPFLAIFVLIFANFLINKNTIYDQLNQGSIFTKISLSRLAQDIDERQKIDYLSSNKNFILPPLIRKFTYNKLALATDRVIRKSISLIDFEQLASPNESYDIVRLSGILPKGNLPLYYIWELPLIAYAAFQLLRKKRDLQLWYVITLISSLIPAIIFEKRDFSQYGIFAHASLFILTIYGLIEINKVYINNRKSFWSAVKRSGRISYRDPIGRLRSLQDDLYNAIDNKKLLARLLYKIALFSFVFLIMLNYLNFLNLVYKKQSDYLKSNTLQYQQISSWIKKNTSSEQNVVITNRFGPTQLAVPAYLDLSFSDYWENYDQVLMSRQNLSFTSFDLKSEVPKSGRMYIGFPGEFVGPSKNHDISMLPTSFELIDILRSNDESVYQFGKDLWVVEAK